MIAPSDLLTPVSDEVAFDRAAAAHLLRRAGFSAPPAEIDAAVRRGLTDTIHHVLKDRTTPDHDRVRRLAETVVRTGNVDALGAWWLRTMVDSPAPLREKLALTWHGHFATSAAKVTNAGWIYRQYTLFREHGAGDLRTLTKAVIRDPAMLRFLDGDTNEKDSPNENLARELYELFLMGIGHYQEHDIQEGARALTGLTHRHGQPHFSPRKHDRGVKTIFGVSDRFNADGLVDHCFRQPVTAEFLAQRLLRTFAEPAPGPELSSAAGELLRTVDFDVSRFLAALFRSKLFWASESRRSMIKGPVEYAVGTVRALEGRADANELGRAVRAMGQRLFYPPGVQGWNGGRDWLNSVRWIARQRFASRFAASWRDDPSGYPLGEWKRARREDLVRSLLTRLVDDEIPAEIRAHLTSSDGEPEDLVAVILTLPEYQLS